MRDAIRGDFERLAKRRGSQELMRSSENVAEHEPDVPVPRAGARADPGAGAEPGARARAGAGTDSGARARADSRAAARARAGARPRAGARARPRARPLRRRRRRTTRSCRRKSRSEASSTACSAASASGSNAECGEGRARSDHAAAGRAPRDAEAEARARGARGGPPVDAHHRASRWRSGCGTSARAPTLPRERGRPAGVHAPPARDRAARSRPTRTRSRESWHALASECAA